MSPEELTWVSRETGMELYQAAILQEASERLRGAPCRIVVLDSGLLETDPKGVDRLLAEIPSTSHFPQPRRLWPGASGMRNQGRAAP